MRLKLWTVIAALLVFATGCAGATDSPAGEADNSAAQQSFTALCERLESAAVYKVAFETDETMNSMKEINVTAPLIGQVAEQLKTAAVADVQAESPGDYEQHLGFTVESGADTVDADLFKCGPDHPEYKDQTVAWVQQGEETTRYLMDNQVFDAVYALLASATYTPEIPASAFVEPIQGVIEKYRSGQLPGESDDSKKWYQPLPDGSVLPDIAAREDFTVREEEGMFGYVAVVPMEGDWNMAVGLALFDGGSWEVASVSFERKSDSDAGGTASSGEAAEDEGASATDVAESTGEESAAEAE